jgi:beta-glucosidase
MQDIKKITAALSSGLLMAGLLACSPQKEEVKTDLVESAPAPVSNTANPSVWPKITSKVKQDPAMEERIAGIIAGLSVEEKVAQIIQPEIRAFTVEDMRKYGFGSFLNGGGAFPNNDKYATMADWSALADAMYEASIDDSMDGNSIPTMWGTDAVHGHNNIIGATYFPHNVGLGAMNNPALMKDIGAATARVVQVTGIDWVFAPTVAVARDDRWGRTYESYSEDPAIVKAYAREIVAGMQGVVGEDFMGDGKVIATSKHFLGDGGTDKGDDQGNELVF